MEKYLKKFTKKTQTNCGTCRELSEKSPLVFSPKGCYDFIPKGKEFKMEINSAQEGPSVTFIGHRITSSAHETEVEMADKQEKIPFYIRRYHHANMNVPRSMYIASYVSMLLTAAESSSNMVKCMETSLTFMTMLKEKRGYLYDWARLGVKKLYASLWIHGMVKKLQALSKIYGPLG